MIVALIAVSLAYFVPGIHQKITLNYTEKTLFAGNNTLINGTFALPEYPEVTLFGYIVYDSIDNLVVTDNLTDIYIINTTTNSVVKSIAYNPPFYQGGPSPNLTQIFYDPLNGNILFQNNILNKTQVINGKTLQVTNTSNLWKAFPVIYDPFNHYFYGPSLTNFSFTVFNSSFSVVDVIPVDGFALYLPYDLAYDPVNHDVYALTSSVTHHTYYYNISVISPQNTIITTIPGPLRADLYIAYLPAYQSIFISNFTAIAEINSSNHARIVQNYSDKFTSQIYSFCMNSSADYMLVLGFRVSVLYNFSRDIGVIPTLDNSNNNPYTTSGPYFGVYVPTSDQYYIVNQLSNREITILTVKVTTQGLAFSGYNPFSALAVFSVTWIGNRYTF